MTSHPSARLREQQPAQAGLQLAAHQPHEAVQLRAGVGTRAAPGAQAGRGGPRPRARGQPEGAGPGGDSASTTLSLDFTLANIGSAAAGPFKIVIYLYPDAANPCRGYPLFTYNYPNGAQPNRQGDVNFSKKLSEFESQYRPPPGTYTVGFVLDSGNAATESDENNNRRMFNIQVKL